MHRRVPLRTLRPSRLKSFACHDPMKVLVLNSGSSSQKTALFELGPELSTEPVSPLWEGKLDWDGNKETLTIKNSSGQEIHTEGDLGPDRRAASVERLL